MHQMIGVEIFVRILIGRQQQVSACPKDSCLTGKLNSCHILFMIMMSHYGQLPCHIQAQGFGDNYYQTPHSEIAILSNAANN